jgi:hypothetical protein
MKLWKGTVGVAAAVLAMGSLVHADYAPASSGNADASVSAGSQSLQALMPTPIMADDSGTAGPAPAAAAAPAAAPTRPLMEGLDKIGVGDFLNNLGINIYGFVEAGFLYDATVPKNLTGPQSFPDDLILFPGPDKNKVILDQLDLTLERDVDASKGKWDVGFKVEGIFGRDAVFTHSDGILDNGNKDGSGEDDQLDLPQAYLTVAVPVGNGLTITAGKFATLLGYETINPTTNQFYTHSYIFSFGIPFTQTGLLATYTFDKLTTTQGFTRGWNQSTSDNNGAIDYLGQWVYKFSDAASLTGTLSIGPEAFHDNGDYFVVPDVIASYKASDNLSLNAEVLYGFANDISQWGGIAAYAGYKVNEYLTINGRYEFYHDGGGVTTGAGIGHDVNYNEITAGASITPMPESDLGQWLTVRPEARFDWADHDVYDFNPTNGSAEANELTFAVDVYYQF